MKKILFMTIAILLLACSVYAEEKVNVANKICPVMGADINEKYAVKAEYKGKIYNLCCYSCLSEFNSDPEKYVKMIEDMMAKEAQK